MKRILLSLLLVASVNLFAGEEQTLGNLDAENSMSLDSMRQHDKRLNHFLSQSDDINIQLSAFTSLGVNDDNINKIKNVLRQAINPLADKYTIFLADRLCHYNKTLTQWCHQNQIHEVHLEIDPENVFSYFFTLNELDDDNKIQQILIEAAEKSRYSETFFFENVLKTADQIVLFNQQNPESFPLDTLYEPQQEEYDFINNLQLVEKGILDKDFNLDENNSKISGIISAIGMEMAVIMTYRNITQACDEFNNADSCLQIADLMIKDKALINQMIAYGLKSKAQKSLGIDESTIQKNKLTIDKTYKELQCYSQNQEVMLAQIASERLNIQYINDAKEFGEVTAMKKLAHAVYNIMTQNGFTPEFNPADCEQTIRLNG